MSDAVTALPHPGERRRARRSAPAPAHHALARGRARRRLVAGHPARLRAGRVRVLGREVRLARARAQAQRAPAVPHEHRRARHPLLSRALAARGRAADRDHARLAGLGGGVPEGDRAARRSRPRTAAAPPTRSTSCVPSLPGYGFSDKPTAKGTGVERIADLWSALMVRLGYPRYVAQGGDWGAIVTTQIGDPRHDALRGHPPEHADRRARPRDDERPDSRRAVARSRAWRNTANGIRVIRSSRARARRRSGYGLVDSPAGQAAWILEKFWKWTDCNGHPENVLTRDELLDNLMLYWLPATGASSARLYWESFRTQSPGARRASRCRPAAASSRRRSSVSSRRWAEKRFTNLVHWNELERGGHFAAFEQPATFVNELRACFRHMRSSAMSSAPPSSASSPSTRAAGSPRTRRRRRPSGCRCCRSRSAPGRCATTCGLAAPLLRRGARRRRHPEGVRRRRSPGLPAHREPRDEPRRHAVHAERRRALDGDPDDPRARHRGAEAALHPDGAALRRDLVPGLLRAGRGIRSRERADQRRAATATTGS